MVHLREIPLGGLADGVLVIAALPSKSEANLDFLGPALPDSIAKAIAEGGLFCVKALLNVCHPSRMMHQRTSCQNLHDTGIHLAAVLSCLKG